MTDPLPPGASAPRDLTGAPAPRERAGPVGDSHRPRVIVTMFVTNGDK